MTSKNVFLNLWPLTFQNKVTVGCPDTNITFLQTSGASNGAEINQRKALGSHMDVEQYFQPSSSSISKVTTASPT